VVRRAFVSSSKGFGLAGALMVCGWLRSAERQVEGDRAGGQALGVRALVLGDLELDVDRQAAQDLVVLAGVDVETWRPRRVLDGLALLVGELVGDLLVLRGPERTRFAEDPVDVVEQLGHVDAGADVDRL
jgi:hypothetical protein